MWIHSIWYNVAIFCGISISIQASLVAQTVKSLPAVQETRVQSLGQEGTLEKEMATHSSILAWKIPWTEEPGRLQSMSCKELDTIEWLHFHFLQVYTDFTVLHAFRCDERSTVSLKITDIDERCEWVELATSAVKEVLHEYLAFWASL